MSALNFVIILLCVIVSSLCIALKLLIADFREVRIKVLKLEASIEADDFADEFVNGLKDLHIIEADRKTENCSEKPNNCEYITEDGVTCAKYPACDDCLDNPLNKLKGSERLVKGSEQTDLVEDSPSLVKDLVKAFGEDGTWLERQGVYTLTLAEAKQRAVDIIESVLAKDEPTISKMEQVDKDMNVRSKYKQGTWLYGDGVYCSCCGYKLETTALLAKCPKCGADMSKTDCAWK